MTRSATMSDVAREANVSLMTVSRVVNGKGEVSCATRQRVLDAIHRLSYSPSSIARSLATSRTGSIGLVVPDNTNPFFSEVARGAEHVSYAHGYGLFLCNTDEDVHRERTILRSLEEKRVDGLVLCSSRLDERSLRSAVTHFPAVVLVNRRLGRGNADAVLVDDVMGGRLAAKHLLDRGHRAIGFLAAPKASRSSRLRLQGYRFALRGAGLQPNPAWLVADVPTIEGGHRTTLQLLSTAPSLTALLCCNDLMAVGALRASCELRRNVPGDLHIVGFDDILLATLVTPPLTTFRTMPYEMGCKAMGLLLERMSGSAGDYREAMFQPQLVVRDSSP